MAASPSAHAIAACKRRLERKYGFPFTVLRASNGEVAILPVCRECGHACAISDSGNVHASCQGFREWIDKGGTLD